MKIKSSVLILSLFLFIIQYLPAQKRTGKQLYEQNCAACHHKQRIGKLGPPLLPFSLKRKKIERLANLIRDGFPQTQMPTFEHLDDESLLAIAKYIKSPADKNISWKKEDILKSIVTFNDPIKDLKIKNIEQVTPVVEREGAKVWIMEDDKILDKFPLKNIHGGIKYQFPNADNIYIPTRDGWVEKYSLKEGRRIAKVRIGINLRNISITRDGKYVMASALLPQQLVILNTSDLKPVKIIPLKGKMSAIYEFYSKDQAIFTYRDQPKVGFFNTKTFQITYQDIAEPIEDYFIDPFDDFIIATARHGKVMRVYDIKTLKVVFEKNMEGMPHLFSACYWYQNGNFYFATPHLRKSYITIWKMYDWKFEKKINVGGDGYFVKTHPNTPYLWVDNASDQLVLINKKDFKEKIITPVKDKQYIHTEFSGDGKYTYLSIYNKKGSIEVLDTKTLKRLKSYPANIPVGKYNFINKNRRFYPMLLGLNIYNQHCKDQKKPLKCLKKFKTNNEYEKRAIDAYLKYQKSKKTFLKTISK